MTFRVLLVVSMVALSAGAPVMLDVFADPCTGTAQPKEVTNMCYQGGHSILGDTWKETVLVHIKEFDAASGKGFLVLDAEGASPQHCPKTPFALKSGVQDIDVTFDKCLSGASATAKYCSDQDSILIHVSVPNKHVPTVPVTLKKVVCPAHGQSKIGPGKHGFKK